MSAPALHSQLAGLLYEALTDGALPQALSVLLTRMLSVSTPQRREVL